MKTTISVKELRMNFPAIRKKLEKGERFTIIYRSKPLAELMPVSPDITDWGDSPNGRIHDLPKNIEEFMKNIEKNTIKIGKPFDAVKEIRKERGNYDQ